MIPCIIIQGMWIPPGKLLDMWPNSLLPSLLSLNIIRAPDDDMTLPVHGRSHACAKAFCIPMHRSEEAVVNMEVHALL